MNGTTRCPLCDTRFRITEAQLTAHQGMVRCGNCQQAFDARPGFIPEQSQPDLAVGAGFIEEHAENAVPETSADAETIANPGTAPDAISLPEDLAEHLPEDFPEDLREHLPENLAEDLAETVSAIPDSTSTEFGDFHLPLQPEHEDTLDFSHVTHTIAEQEQLAEPVHGKESSFEASMPWAEQALHVEHVEHEEHVNIEDRVPAKRRTWPWVTGIAVSAILVIAQSAYFFRVGLAAHLPALKPALVGTCHLLNCSVPLPKNSELMSIESSDLVADSEHENQITLNALLRNRAGFTQAFPVLALTFNDGQDKPLARRLFLPTEYLPTDESEQTGFAVNHEVSIKVHLNTADLKPSGYRLELFYNQN